MLKTNNRPGKRKDNPPSRAEGLRTLSEGTKGVWLPLACIRLNKYMVVPDFITIKFWMEFGFGEDRYWDTGGVLPGGLQYQV